MNIKAVEKICNVLGQVFHSADPIKIEGGNFIRIRVLMDVTLPLCRGQIISMENGKTMWITFKYERLPKICYWCGHLEHDDRDCASQRLLNNRSKAIQTHPLSLAFCFFTEGCCLCSRFFQIETMFVFESY